MGYRRNLSGAGQVVLSLGLLGCLLGAAPKGGSDSGVLRLSVATNTVSRPGVHVRVGQRLVRVYRLRNYAEYGLDDLEVRDAQAPGGRARCPEPSLAPLGTMTCRAEIVASAGPHTVRVTATGVPAWEGLPGGGADAPAGYEAHHSALVLQRSASQKRLSYRLMYAGPTRLDDLRLDDPLLGNAGALRCSGGAGLPGRLLPGGSVDCWAPAPAGPGRHRSVARATGTTADRAVSSAGSLLPPLPLAAEAAAEYVVPAPPRAIRPPGGPSAGPSRTPPTPGNVRPPRTPRPPRAQRPPRAPRPPGASIRPSAPTPLSPPGVAAPPGGLPPGAGPGQVPGAGAGDAAAGAMLRPPGAPTAPGRRFLLNANPPARVPARPPATPGAVSAHPPPPGRALSGQQPSSPRRETLMDRVDWAVLTLLIVLIPALLAAMSFESRKATSRGKDD
ncbi:hypothetical protein ABIC27_005842 [Streptomyces sp. PvR034]